MTSPIKEQRELAQLSIADVTDALVAMGLENFTADRLAEVEAGKHAPTTTEAFALAIALDCQLLDLGVDPYPDIAATLGARLGSRINKAGAVRSRLAEEAGIKPSSLSRIQAGRRVIGFGAAARIADACNFSLDDLVDGLDLGPAHLAPEAGGNALPSLVVMARICQGLGISLDEAARRLQIRASSEWGVDPEPSMASRVMDYFREHPDAEVRVQDLIDAGVGPDDACIRTPLHRAWENGILERVSRGVYKLADDPA